ncbi:MAG: HAMP domain-containing histidine kinase [Desulfurivibrio sp.]|nr:HAMP domain-containing histidine kinase [Desulfurivibrio sp.]MBU3936984.1 HAMP domain-containing histidine kinase [Pseudomonadota bacterium]MBU4034522.1 HAMP domain-containing histidine kinase [Pseudomonadota bacterium]MBU4117772.1 HAMP domain-containing histidine kinase [Pseudomonadota bacterium]
MAQKAKVLVISSLVVLISLLHYFTQQTETFHHIVFREVYFLPVILAGFWYGLRGGLIVSLLITAFYGPFILLSSGRAAYLLFGNVMELLLLNIVGVLVGWLRDRETKSQAALRNAESLAAMGTAVSAIAHDMKTPLVAIGGFAGQLRKKINDETLLKKVDAIISQSARLETMVRDMLAFSRPLTLKKDKGNLKSLAEETIETAAEIARKRGVQFVFEAKDDLSEVVFDAHRLQQAILNLVVNAVEASPNGETVAVIIRKHGDMVEIDVADRGEGIREDQRDEIFKPFVSSKKTGTGLGLAIVKKIAEAHGGGIAVLTNQKQGTIFRFSLPRT